MNSFDSVFYKEDNLDRSTFGRLQGKNLDNFDSQPFEMEGWRINYILITFLRT